MALVVVSAAMLLHSCGGGRSYMFIPHSVSSASAVTVENLNLSKGDYDVLKTVTESASVVCEYKNSEIIITDGDGNFSYVFKNDGLTKGWSLERFSGMASFGYFTADHESTLTVVPSPQEFARRVAMSRIIETARDYNADGVIEPVTITKVENLSHNKVEYTTTVSAKLIIIKTTN